MRDRLRSRLLGGDRKSLGEAESVADEVRAVPALFDDVVALCLDDDLVVRARAINIVDWVTRDHPEWLGRHKRTLLTRVAALDQWEIHQALCLVIPRMKLTPIQRERALELIRAWLDGKSNFVRTFAMQALYDLSQQDASLKREAISTIDRLLETGSAAVRARARKLQKELDRPARK